MNVSKYQIFTYKKKKNNDNNKFLQKNWMKDELKIWEQSKIEKYPKIRGKNNKWLIVLKSNLFSEENYLTI